MFSAIFPFYSTRLNLPMVWVELKLGQKVKMMTLQSNSDHSIGTLVTSVTRVYQIEVDLDVDSSLILIYFKQILFILKKMNQGN
jgi:hypothetical protein